MKFGLLIDIDLLKRGTSASPKPVVKLRQSGRHLENRRWSDLDEIRQSDAE